MGTDHTKEENTRKTVKSDEKLFSIIEYLKAHDYAGVTEIANGLEMAKSTVHLHLNTLLDSGYAVKNGTQYGLSLKFLDIGMSIKNRREIYKKVEPRLAEIAEKTGEQVWFWVPENRKAVVISKSLGTNSLYTNGRIGKYTDLHCTAGGKALLAHMSNEQVHEILNSHELVPRTENTVTSAEKLITELEEIKETGIAVNNGENIKRVNAIAAAIVDNNDTLHGSISISGPSTRLKASTDSEHAELLKEVTKELGINFSYL